jgi:hypothetical protein
MNNRFLFSTTIINVILLLVVNPSYTQIPIAYYKFDNNALDFSGNRNNGNIIGGVNSTIDRFGNSCGALYFNGSDGYIEVPSSLSLESPNNAITVTCWFKIENSPSSPGKRWLSLICKGNSPTETPDNPQYRVQTLQLQNASTISINTDFTEYDMDFSSHLFEYGKWSFYALVYDRNFVKTFIDGNEVWSFPYSKTFTQNSSPLHIAKDIPGSTEFFCGSLDDLRIFNTALSKQQLNNIYLEKPTASFQDEFELKCPDNTTAYTEKDNCFSRFDFKKPTIEANCGKVTVRQIEGLPTGSNFSLGENYISFLAEGATKYKSSCTFQITVIDKYPPQLVCPNDVTLNITNSTETAKIFDFSFPDATDNCSVSKVIQIAGAKSGSAFPLGTNQLKFRATDNSGNIAECSYNVVVLKTTPTVSKFSLKCPKDVVKVNDISKCGASVNYENPVITGSDSASLTLVAGYESGNFFDVGETTNTYKASIGATVENKCSFRVTVQDREKPQIICPNDTIIQLAEGQTQTTFEFDLPEAKDNCGIDTVFLLSGIATGKMFPIGTTTNSIKAIDIYGNASICSFNVVMKSSTSIPIKKEAPTQQLNRIENDSVYYEHELTSNNCIITVVMYDDGEEDNDTVSLYYNNKLLVDRQMIMLKSTKTIIKALVLNPDEPNVLISKAVNTGKVGPNTLKIEFYEGNLTKDEKQLKKKKPFAVKILHSKLGLAGAIKLKCNL